MANKTDRWWQASIGYIIYPQSFQDSDGDGVGDLQGIISRLDYLSFLGVNLLWICPFFASPMDDNGYDVSDYLSVDPRFGTKEDFLELLEKAHARGIRIIIDFVLNHTSDEHPWFQKALKDLDSEEAGYYFFRQGRRENGELLPPNNWKGFFSTSAWENVKGTDLFYLHIFSKKMPDVNWDNPELRQRYIEIAKEYLSWGVDGFRLDAVAHLAKDLSFSDAEGEADENGLVCDTSKFSNRPELYSYLKELHDSAFVGSNCLVVGEAGGGIRPDQAAVLADYQNGPIDMVFNFDTAWNNGAYGSIDKKDWEIRPDVLEMKRNFLKWYEECHGRCDMPLYWNNHDHPRVLSQYGSVEYRDESAKMLLSTLLFLYGTPFLFNGEEIGMSNVQYRELSDFDDDVSSKNEIESLLKQGYEKDQILHYMRRTSRVNGHQPMQWDGSPFGGFSTKEGPVKMNPNHLEGVNVETEMKDTDSILHFYKYAIGMRKDPAINAMVLGEFEFLDFNHPDVFAYMHRGDRDIMIVISSFRPYTTYFSFYYRISDVLLHNYDDVILIDHVFTLRPYESFVLKVDY